MSENKYVIFPHGISAMMRRAAERLMPLGLTGGAIYQPSSLLPPLLPPSSVNPHAHHDVCYRYWGVFNWTPSYAEVKL